MNHHYSTEQQTRQMIILIISHSNRIQKCNLRSLVRLLISATYKVSVLAMAAYPH